VESLSTILFVAQVLIAVSLIGFILIQQGKGADAGAAFGSGASQTVFGAGGSGNFLTKATAVLAVMFLVNSLALGWLASQRIQVAESVIQEQESAVILDAEDIDESFVIPETFDVPVTPDLPAGELDVPDLPVQ
jgi:preprotein translocase subunit SecG